MFEGAEGRAFDLSAEIPGTDSTLSDLRARHAALAGIVRKMDSKATAENVPISFFNSAMNALRSISNAADQIETEIDNVKNHGGLNTFDFASFIATTINGQQINFSPPFKTLFDNSEAYLIGFHSLFQAINPSRASFNFSAATTALSSTISRASKLRMELGEALNEAHDRLKSFHEKDSELAAHLARANSDATSITEQVGRSSEAVAQIEGFKEQSKNIATEAAELQVSVEQYRDIFEEFENKLTVREKKFESGTRSLDELIAEFTEQREFVRSIIEQSDKMLSGATVAGLSSEFKTIKEDLTTQLDKAYTAFGFSIAFLFASAIPLIVFIFAPFIAPLLSDDANVTTTIAAMGTERSGWQYVGQVLARFIILLPAIWFVTFTTARYNSLFKLREHYAYKYSMAMAVDGFKKQAPGHEDLIAALVFEQLAFNPADKLGKSKENSENLPNPVMQILLDHLRKRVERDTDGAV
ncbi:hypothetical protein [Allopontixanthobacter sp.]|uniref:hypothetical protein n=1 Tax=Allopontixanthobacter sp. TaxID=2906452 RepID=UPI002ABA5FFA|nr:hypothetical protein [Allopontixanthobacter sp.]MDZ4306281.1 hypothetical protein [Allopontixanthobacter sp.]